MAEVGLRSKEELEGYVRGSWRVQQEIARSIVWRNFAAKRAGGSTCDALDGT